MNRFQKNLQQLEDKNRLRSLVLPDGVDLTSNDYLCFRDHPFLRKAALGAIEAGVALGSGGSRLLRGHTLEHQALEEYASQFFGSESALFFPTGYQANIAIFETLPSRRDTIIFDALIHASARQGIQNSHAKHIRAAHNDLNAYEEALKSARESSETLWIAVESLYSMDGDLAPLDEIYELAQRYEAILIVDEAHATGVFGAQGTGLTSSLRGDRRSTRQSRATKSNSGLLRQRDAFSRNDVLPDNIIVLHTCGKGLGVAGGLICASKVITDTLINTARPFIYSTAPPPLQAHVVQKALELCASDEGETHREKLFAIMSHAKNIFSNSSSPAASRNGGAVYVQSQIIPVILGSDALALETAQVLRGAGYDIRAIRPPTVPEGTARLRLSLHAGLTPGVLDGFASVLVSVLERQGEAA